MTFPAVTRHAADLLREMLAKAATDPIPASIEVSPIGWAKIRRQADAAGSYIRTRALGDPPGTRTLLGMTVRLEASIPASSFEVVFTDGRRERFPL